MDALKALRHPKANLSRFPPMGRTEVPLFVRDDNNKLSFSRNMA
jgi:hypothetical protein